MREPGSERADFERLMRESYRLVYQVAYSVPGNAADAEEVTQDTFLTAYRKFDSLRDPERFRPRVARASSPRTGKRRQFRDRNSQNRLSAEITLSIPRIARRLL